MKKEQRKKILSYLCEQEEFFDERQQLNELRQDDKHWYVREDKIPINKSDGSCALINQRLIDPLLFDWLVETLTIEGMTAKEILKSISEKKAEVDSQWPVGRPMTLHNESRCYLVRNLITHKSCGKKFKPSYSSDNYHDDGIVLNLPYNRQFYLIKTFCNDGTVHHWNQESKATSPLTDSQIEFKIDHEIMKATNDPVILPYVPHDTVRVNTYAGVIRVKIEDALKLFNHYVDDKGNVPHLVKEGPGHELLVLPSDKDNKDFPIKVELC